MGTAWFFSNGKRKEKSAIPDKPDSLEMKHRKEKGGGHVVLKGAKKGSVVGGMFSGRGEGKERA